jgi:hypothetical protein
MLYRSIFFEREFFQHVLDRTGLGYNFFNFFMLLGISRVSIVILFLLVNCSYRTLLVRLCQALSLFVGRCRCHCTGWIVLRFL